MPIICRPNRDPGSKLTTVDSFARDYYGERYEPTDSKILTKQPSLTNVREAVCAFVDKSLLSRTGRNGSWRLKARVPTLEQDLRESLEYAIEDKKNDLLDAMVPEMTQETEREALDALPWPNPDTVALTVPFSDQKIPCQATGFHIGNNLVVTAGHVTEDVLDQMVNGSYNTQGNEFLQSTLLIFGFYGDIANRDIPDYQVYKISRVILHYDPSTSTLDDDLYGNRRGFPALAAAADHYDAGIIEIKRASTLNPTPAPAPLQSLRLCTHLPINTGDAKRNAPVYTVGHGCGLSQKVSWGGHIIKSPVNGGNAAPAGPLLPGQLPPPLKTITCDLDNFKGNSGGPVMIARSEGPNPPLMDVDVVVANVASGEVIPFAADRAGANVPDNPLERRINGRPAVPASANAPLQARVAGWVDGKTPLFRKDDTDEWVALTAAEAQALIDARLGPIPAGQPPRQIQISQQWLSTYTEMQLYEQGQKLGYQRLDNTYRLCTELEAYTRMDVYNYFTQPLRDFMLPNPVPVPVTRPYGKVELSIKVRFGGTGNWAGACWLDVDDGSAPPLQGTVSAAAPVAGAAGSLEWRLDTSNPHLAGATLSNILLQSPRGLAGWKMLTIRRVAPAGTAAWQPGELRPIRADISAKFTVTRASSVAQQPFPWETNTAYTFKSTVSFRRNPPPGDSWTGRLGKMRSGGAASNDAIWRGPV